MAIQVNIAIHSDVCDLLLHMHYAQVLPIVGLLQIVMKDGICDYELDNLPWWLYIAYEEG